MASILPNQALRVSGNSAALLRLKTDPVYQSFWLLRIGFTVAPIAFGLDKFFHLLVN